MFQDGKCMFGIDMAFGDTPAVLDLKTATAGPGRPLRISVNGEDIAGATGIVVSTGATSALGTTLVTFTATAADLNNGMVFELPDNIQQFVGVAFAGTASAGTWTSGLVLEEGQTNL